MTVKYVGRWGALGGQTGNRRRFSAKTDRIPSEFSKHKWRWNFYKVNLEQKWKFSDNFFEALGKYIILKLSIEMRFLDYILDQVIYGKYVRSVLSAIRVWVPESKGVTIFSSAQIRVSHSILFFFSNIACCKSGLILEWLHRNFISIVGWKKARLVSYLP